MGKIQDKTFFFRFFSCPFSFLYTVIKWFCSFAFGVFYLKYILVQNQFSSSSYFCCNFLSSYFLFSLNCSFVSCVTSTVCIVDVRSLLMLPMAKSSTSCKAFNFKMFFCADSHFYSSLLFPVINWFHAFKKYNMHTTRLYNTLIKYVQHALI